MLPLALDLSNLPVAVVGRGDVVLKRLRLVDEAGAHSVAVYALEPGPELAAAAGDRLRPGVPEAAALAGVRLVIVAGLERGQAASVAAAARSVGALVNVEDVVELCDVHLPALVRRGDLTIAVSTAGRSPALARRLRRHLEGEFGPEWQERLRELGEARRVWREQGLTPGEVSRRSDAYLDEKGWLA
ncbi:precorrin-2 dehydrogenase/sirohydrochlorin ferrochelatase family protein [Zavarzinia compransoris]|uniref:precorrin-2 dehydrogenase n=1 Tax=Zavarzinia compransoris TaxID=1264899 RepID=A0A317DVM5_9PROT|nr:NAD(P)-dependent oxidoreductase [Zavarzinia compransoris]PWR18020.1 siroheme synthase [Zavarzinia compransoris]TDP43515.1 precorrin-2 dehydrogenase/sirohydrochlorin ferrochelatase [Zavarzinia compransoris]